MTSQPTVEQDLKELQTEVSQLKLELRKLAEGQRALLAKIEDITQSAPSSKSVASTDAPATKALGGKENPKLKMGDYLKQKKSVFDLKVLNAFINAVRQTAQGLFGKEVKFLAPQPVLPGQFFNFANGARMKLTKGAGSGYMGVGFKANHINTIACSIFAIGMNEVTGTMITDLTKEFCNQVFGQAKAILLKEGIEYTITTPEVIAGSQLEIRKSWGDPYLALVFTLDDREFYILFW